MTNHTIKAKNKKTGEVVEFIVIDKGYENHYTQDNNLFYTKEGFDYSFEVVEDTDKPISSTGENGIHQTDTLKKKYSMPNRSYYRVFKVGEILDFNLGEGVFKYGYSGTAKTKEIEGNRLMVTEEGTIYDIHVSNGAMYPVKEGSGSDMYDISGNGLHISNVGGTWIDTSDWRVPEFRGYKDTDTLKNNSVTEESSTTENTLKKEDWDIGSFTFDELKNIMDVCNVNNVKIQQDYLSINFVPKNVTGNRWRELKEKMHQIIKK